MGVLLSVAMAAALSIILPLIKSRQFLHLEDGSEL